MKRPSSCMSISSSSGTEHNTPIRFRREQLQAGKSPIRFNLELLNIQNPNLPPLYPSQQRKEEQELWRKVMTSLKKVNTLAKTPLQEDEMYGLEPVPYPHYSVRWKQLYPPEVMSQSERTTTVNKAYPNLTLVGSGTYGSVYQTESQTKMSVALKRIYVPENKIGLPVSAVREWRILQRLNHRNIVSLLDIIPGDEIEQFLLVDDESLYHRAFLEITNRWCNMRICDFRPLLEHQRQFEGRVTSEEEKTSLYRRCREELKKRSLLKRFDEEVLECVTALRNKPKLESRAFWMVFEYLDHDLSGLLDNKDTYLKKSEIKYIFHEIAQGLKFCHNSGVMHRDVKGSNILINNSGEVKLCDFGLSCIIKENEEPGYSNRVVTLWYRAPELLLGSTQYSFEVDVWSVGCVFAEMLLKSRLFKGKSDLNQFHRICEKCGVPNEATWPGVTRLVWYSNMVEGLQKDIKRNIQEAYENRIASDALDLLDSILILNPKKRPNIATLLRNDYFTKNDPAMTLPRISHTLTSLNKSDSKVDPHHPSSSCLSTRPPSSLQHSSRHTVNSISSGGNINT